MFIWKDYVWLMLSLIVVYMRIDLIQTSHLVLGREIPLSSLDSTLGKPPHRVTLFENIIKKLEGGHEGIRP
jgi:hypothetical protein